MKYQGAGVIKADKLLEVGKRPGLLIDKELEECSKIV